MGRTLSMHPTLIENLTIFQLEKYFAPKFTTKKNDCWEWTAALFPTGYGAFGIREARKKFNIGASTAHRAMYELIYGQQIGLVIDHICRNRKCVNPKHLEAISPAENVYRGIGIASKNRNKLVCKNGHPYTKENTYWRQRIGKNIERDCNACRKLAVVRYKEKNLGQA